MIRHRDRQISYAVRRMQRILPVYPPLRHRDPVAWVDLQTSLHDARTALCVAIGVPLDEIHPATGHDMQRDHRWIRAIADEPP